MKTTVYKIFIFLFIFLLIVTGFNTKTYATNPDINNQDTKVLEETKQLVQEKKTAVIFKDSKYNEVVPNSKTEISLEGLFPQDSIVKAYPVDLSLKNKKVLVAYDITIFDKDNKEYQPTNENKIKVNIINQKISTGKNIQVVHVHDKEKLNPEIISDLEWKEDSVSFEASSFSVYAVTQPETHFTHTFEFYDENNLINKQILSDGESLSQPTFPKHDGKIFNGWFDESNHKFESWGQVSVNTASKTTKLYARFSKKFYVVYEKYATADHHDHVIASQLYGENDVLITKGIPFKTDKVDEALIGWTTIKNGDEPNVKNGETVVNKDLVLYPVVKQAHWITYDSQGGTPIEPEYVLYGKPTTSPNTNPAKIGYDFDGWYENKEGYGNKFTFGSTLSSNKTLYAKWTPSRTKYTVVFWRQSVKDKLTYYSDSQKSYDYAESHVREGYTDGLTDITYDDRRKDDTSNRFFGFSYNSNLSQNKTIKADGSTVLNVYYDRLTIKFNFYNQNYYNDFIRTIEGLYGSTFKDNNQTWDSNYNWAYIDNNNQMKTSTFLEGYLLDAITKNRTSIDFYRRTLGRYRIKHYIETLDSGNYNLKNTATSSSRSEFIFTNKYDGFTVSQYREYRGYWTNWRRATGSVNGFDVLEIRHSRNSYRLDYVNGLAGVVKSENIKFEAPLNGYDTYRPNKPPELPDYYEFKGWFKDPTGEKSFDFNGIMPSNNVSVYAVWKPKNIKVRFETLSLENPRYEINLEAGNKVPEQKEPIKTGYTFAGWTNASGIPYNFNTILEDDTVLYANWVSNGEGIPLIYHANGGVGTDYLDSVIDERGNKIINYFEPGNSSAKLDYIPQSWHGPTEDGKIKGFVGWTLNEDGSGKIYYPGDEFPIPDDAPKTGINLYAKWAPIRETKLAYDFNYPGSPGRHVVDIETPNEKTPINIENPVRSGYLFKGWTVKQDGAGRLLKKGDLVQVDTLKPETNVLYANWIRIIKVKVKKLVKGNQGNLNKDYEFKYQYLNSNGQTIVNTIKLKNNQDIEIGYIPEGSTFSIVESDYLSDGYTTYVSDDKTSDVKTNVWSYQVNKNSPDIVNVTFTNSKDVSPPTGIILDNLPLIVMVGIGGSWLLFYFISKIRNKSDE